MTIRYTELGIQMLSAGCNVLTVRERQVMRLAGGSAVSQKLLAAMGQEGQDIVQDLLRRGYLVADTAAAEPYGTTNPPVTQFVSTRLDMQDSSFHVSGRDTSSVLLISGQQPMLELDFSNTCEDEFQFNSAVFDLHEQPEIAPADTMPILAEDLQKARKHLTAALSTLPDVQSQELVQKVLMHKEGELALDYIMRAVEHYANITDKERASRLRAQLASLLPPSYVPLLELGI